MTSPYSFWLLYTADVYKRQKENHEAANGAFRGFLKCLRSVEEAGVLNAAGCYAPGSIADTEWMAKAYEMGKTV